jgi:hypothetical protein
MANVTLQLDKSIVGYGTAGDVITVVSTQQTTDMVTNGQAHVYAGPITPTVLPLNLGRNVISSAVAINPTAAPQGQDTVYFLTAAPAVPTLQTAVGFIGTILTFKNTSGGSITPLVTSAQTIDGAVPSAIANNGTLRVISDGANWRTV